MAKQVVCQKCSSKAADALKQSVRGPRDEFINSPGNILHATTLDRLDTIVKYGLVSMQHNRDWKEKTYLSSGYKFDGCPCNQNISKEIMASLDTGGYVFFQALGVPSINGGMVTVRNTHWAVCSTGFGILVTPSSFLNNTPKREEYELGAFRGDKEAIALKSLYEFWDGLRRKAMKYRMGKIQPVLDWAFTVPCCVPWVKFDALIVFHGEGRDQNCNRIVTAMKEIRPREQKPVYDTFGNVLYAP